MTTQILATKLYIPVARPGSVLRSGLINRLNAGSRDKLTLVSAPAGFGKTTLVSEWINSDERATAWLSLDESDNNPAHFLSYLIAALQTIAPQIGKSISGLLESPQQIPMVSLLTPLLNELVEIPYDFALILDDYHVLESKEIDAALAFLIDNQPPTMHIIITTREDPQLPLARLRVRGELTELRATDLRFSPEEAAEFLNEGMGLSLKPDDIAALTARTEGWIAGLQLAAISLKPQQDTSDFIQSFTGNHHFVLDYLVEEVLNRQPDHIQEFLLKTSILSQLCAPLCDAILQDSVYSSQELLRDIQQANLFLVALDNERYWFRYHHLFAELLRKRLGQSASTEIDNLHIRASKWFEQHDQRPAAIRHALTAKDFERAAAMIELEWVTSHSTVLQNHEIRAWMKALPESVYRNRPVLSAGHAWVLLDFGELDAADTRLHDAERWLDPDGQTNHLASEIIVADEAGFQKLPATVAGARAYHSLATGNIPETIEYGQRALALAAENDHHQRGIARSLLGLAYWWGGDLQTAYQFMVDGMESMYKLGNIPFALSSSFGLADVLLGQGRLMDAIDIYQTSLQVAQAQPYQIQGISDLYLGLGDLYREQNNLGSATDYLNKSEMLGEQAGLPDWRVRFCKAQARMKQISGDFDSALDLLDEAERLYYITPLPNFQPIPAMKAQVWVKQGQINKAIAWAHDQHLSLDSDVMYLNEYNLRTLARIHIAQLEQGQAYPSIDDLTQLLERLLHAAETGKRMGGVIETCIVHARLQWLQDKHEDALTSLHRALQLAEPHGYVRIFVDEGEIMEAMLSQAIAQDIFPAYTQKLLAAYEPVSLSSSSPPAQPLTEPLSERELEILQLVADGLSNREVSDRLYIALNTVKGHNRNIFQKLQVKRRTEAIARARELGLI